MHLYDKIRLASRTVALGVAITFSVVALSQPVYAIETNGVSDINDTDSLPYDVSSESNEDNTLFLDGDTLSEAIDTKDSSPLGSDDDPEIIEESEEATDSDEFTIGDVTVDMKESSSEGYYEDTYMGYSMEGQSDYEVITNDKAASPRTGTYTHVNGIDVSHYQGAINWSAVRAAGYEFVFVKVSGTSHERNSTFNLYTDPNFRSNLSGAAAAGLKVGAYHYSQALNTSEAAAEATYICNLISGYNITMPVVIDYEWNSSERLVDGGSYSNRTNVCATFCNVVVQRGYAPCIYANDSCCRNYINAASLSSSYKLWIARYSSSFPSCNALIDFWQYSSSGSVPGISGRVDMDYWYSGTYVPVASIPVSTNPNYYYMYRLCHLDSGEHFYTASRTEASHISQYRWRYEGVAWSSPYSGQEVYRLCNLASSTHFYTKSPTERDHLTHYGWRYEGVAFRSGGSRPVYRLCYIGTAIHIYTQSATERDHISKYNWRYEGIEFYTG